MAMRQNEIRQSDAQCQSLTVPAPSCGESVMHQALECHRRDDQSV